MQPPCLREEHHHEVDNLCCSIYICAWCQCTCAKRAWLSELRRHRHWYDEAVSCCPARRRLHFRTPAWVKSLFDIANSTLGDGSAQAAKLGMSQGRINEIRDAVVNEQRQTFLFDSPTAENCESLRQSGLLAKLDATRAKFPGNGCGSNSPFPQQGVPMVLPLPSKPHDPCLQRAYIVSLRHQFGYKHKQIATGNRRRES
jgi:hypothetical protein